MFTTQSMNNSLYKITITVAIHNKNGKGLLQEWLESIGIGNIERVAIHNKNGKGLLLIWHK